MNGKIEQDGRMMERPTATIEWYRRNRILSPADGLGSSDVLVEWIDHLESHHSKSGEPYVVVEAKTFDDRRYRSLAQFMDGEQEFLVVRNKVREEEEARWMRGNQSVPAGDKHSTQHREQMSCDKEPSCVSLEEERPRFYVSGSKVHETDNFSYEIVANSPEEAQEIADWKNGQGS